jgi:DNA (cytosine-5)-methyltransferase 1
LAEIEPFPSAVLAHHYPDVPNLGDMTTIADKILSGDVAAPDVLVGGTPCQAFSIAGLRHSLDDSRGQLTLEYVRLANAIDTARLNAGQQPVVCLWENVPGVLNTKDNAFGCLLAALAGESDPLQPSGRKWTNAGCVFGPQRAVAWRVLDAQFFGVPQRRRRVFVVASARDAFDPSEILFEFDGVRRDIAPSRKTGQEVARDVGLRSKTANVTFDRQSSGEYGVAPVASTMAASDYKSASDLVVAYSFDALASNSMKSANPHSGCREVDLSKTLDSSHPCPSKNQGGIGIVQATYGIAGNIIGRSLKNGGNGQGYCEDVSYTLTKTDQHGVAYAVTCASKQQSQSLGFDVASPIMANDYKEPQVVAYAYAGAKQQNYICESSDCLNPDQPQCWRVYRPDGVAPALQSGEGRGNAVYVPMAVRRLMPVECERLQGFPDHYTRIPYRKKTADLCPDSPRYKALGNSMAVPCMAWIGKRIADYVGMQP